MPQKEHRLESSPSCTEHQLRGHGLGARGCPLLERRRSEACSGQGEATNEQVMTRGLSAEEVIWVRVPGGTACGLYCGLPDIWRC